MNYYSRFRGFVVLGNEGRKSQVEQDSEKVSSYCSNGRKIGMMSTRSCFLIPETTLSNFNITGDVLPDHLELMEMHRQTVLLESVSVSRRLEDLWSRN